MGVACRILILVAVGVEALGGEVTRQGPPGRDGRPLGHAYRTVLTPPPHHADAAFQSSERLFGAAAFPLLGGPIRACPVRSVGHTSGREGGCLWRPRRW